MADESLKARVHQASTLKIRFDDSTVCSPQREVMNQRVSSISVYMIKKGAIKKVYHDRCVFLRVQTPPPSKNSWIRPWLFVFLKISLKFQEFLEKIEPKVQKPSHVLYRFQGVL